MSAEPRTPPPAPPPAEPPPADRPTRVASVALTGLFLLAVVYTLYFASNVLLPIVIAVLASLVLEPLVKLLERVRVPSAIGALVLVLALLGGVAWGTLALARPAAEWLERAPAASREIERKLRFVRDPIERVSQATQEMERAATVGGDGRRSVVVEPPSLIDTLLDTTQRFTAGAVVAVILLYFLLANPDGLLEKLVSLAPQLSDKKRVVATMRQIEADVSRYLVTVSAINAGLGVAVGVVLHLLGVPNAALWGALAALSNFVPYAGALVMALVIAAVGVLSFDEPSAMFLPALAFVSLTTIEAYLVTPIVLGARLTLSPVAVFLSVTVWSWLWGIPGALIAVPLLAAAKIVASNVPRLEPLARVLD
ncbi:MAG TPA: AI-2E family transporter [Myxococcota bacterium]